MSSQERPAVTVDMRTCRFCGADLSTTFVDLGMSPLCQTQVEPDQLDMAEVFFPLHVMICDACLLVQLSEYVSPSKIFSANYPYYSSFSHSWLEHARRYSEHARSDLGIGSESFVVELASNDGYLLQNFVLAGIPCLGIEPSAGVGEEARKKGVPTLTEFFGSDTARAVLADYGKADLIVGNNVLAHVPSLNDFIVGIRTLLAPDGLVTLEFPHLQKLMELNQFDTIYHEHFSYFSLHTVRRIFAHHGLTIFDVVELPTHGGSLRIYAAHQGCPCWPVNARVETLLAQERAANMHVMSGYTGFADKVHRAKWGLLDFLIKAKQRGASVVGYGAPGKGNTLLNYCGIRDDFLEYTVDRNPHKQGTYTPGTRIAIRDPAAIEDTKPDYILILPWNLKDEVVAQLTHAYAWGCKFVVAIPIIEIIG